MFRRCVARSCVAADPFKSRVVAAGGAATQWMRDNISTSHDQELPSDPLKDVRSFATEATPETTEAEATEDALRRRLQYQSNYRGMTEMDLIMGAFAEDCMIGELSKYEALRLTKDELAGYDALLREFDNDLYHWLVEVAVAGDGSGAAEVTESVEPGKKERGVVPQRLQENPAWGKLVEYTKLNRDRFLSFR